MAMATAPHAAPASAIAAPATGRLRAIAYHSPKPAIHERDLLLARRGGEREQGEREQPFLVEVPEREEQERRRERDGMELVQRQPAGRRIEQVGEREAEAGPPRCEVLPREPEDGKRAECDRDRLHDEQQVRARPEPPQWGEEHEDRIDVRGEPGDLLAVEVGHAKRMPVRRRPDGLHHVAEVEASRDERFDDAVTRARAKPAAYAAIAATSSARALGRPTRLLTAGARSALASVHPTPVRRPGVRMCASSRGDSASEPGISCEPPDRACERLWIARRNEQRARPVA